MVKKARYSWLKNLILAILASDDAMHGYVIYKRIEEAVGMKWKPSIGTFYRVLMKLRSEGMIECYKHNRRTLCKISDRGLSHMIDEMSLHLPKFLGILSELLKAYLHIARSKNASIDLDTVNRLEKLMKIVSEYVDTKMYRDYGGS